MFRIVIKDSVEDRVLTVQDRKRDLANVAFGVTDSSASAKAKGRVTRLDDIKMLLGRRGSQQQGVAGPSGSFVGDNIGAGPTASAS
jgi:hypothetical protein